MPNYTDKNGVTKMLALTVDTNTPKGKVIEKGLRNGKFTWFEVKGLLGPGFVPLLDCWYCGMPIGPPNSVTAEHVVEQRAGGDHGIGNLEMACLSCNAGWRRRDNGPASNTRYQGQVRGQAGNIAYNK